MRIAGQLLPAAQFQRDLEYEASHPGWVCELLGGLATVIAVAGVLLNNARVIWCFPVWMASNGLTLVLHVRRRMWTLAARDAIFLGLAAAGWWMWTR